MKTPLKMLAAKAALLAALGLATTAQAAPFNLADTTATPTDGLLHHVGGSKGGRGDGVFGGAFPFSFRHGQFNYGQLGVSRFQTLKEQRAIRGSRYYTKSRSSKNRSHRSRSKRRF